MTHMRIDPEWGDLVPVFPTRADTYGRHGTGRSPTADRDPWPGLDVCTACGATLTARDLRLDEQRNYTADPICADCHPDGHPGYDLIEGAGTGEHLRDDGAEPDPRDDDGLEPDEAFGADDSEEYPEYPDGYHGDHADEYDVH